MAVAMAVAVAVAVAVAEAVAVSTRCMYSSDEVLQTLACIFSLGWNHELSAATPASLRVTLNMFCVHSMSPFEVI